MFPARFLAGAFLCAFSTVTVPLSATAAPRALSFEDFRHLRSVSSPQISPDGKRVVYVRSRINWSRDRYDTELVLVDVTHPVPRVLTHDRTDVAEPRWSPDGTRIAYISAPAEKKPPQIYVLPMDGGDSQRITDSKTGVLSFAWRPDGKALAYVAEDEPPNKTAIAHHLDAVTITDNDYLTQEASQPAHLWTIDADGSHTLRLTSGSWSVTKNTEPAWSADGTKIYYQRQPDAVFAHWVEQTTYVVDVATHQDWALGHGVTQNPAVSDDGTMIAMDIPRHRSVYLQNDLYVRRVSDGNELFSSRAADRNVHHFAWLPSGGIAFVTADGVHDVLWTMTSTSAPRKVDTGEVDVAPDFTVAHDGGIAFVGLRTDHPPEVYYLPAGGGPVQRLTDENAWIDGFAIARTTEVQWTIDNGMRADGVLAYPIGYAPGRKYPLVLDIHGGPIETSTWNMTGLEGGELAQVLAARGYLVFRPNYRGSDNMGDAFVQAIVGDVTSGPGRDNLAGVEALRKMGIVDDSRIGVSGWSGGGLQTSWLIGHASFWRAAVTGAGVHDWYQQALLADINEYFGQTFFNELPFTPSARKAYAAESPITYVDNVRTPTLILSDTRDPRVPVSQSYTLYHALRDRGVPVQFTAFPRYGHFPRDPVGREQVLRAWAGWFERWMP
jgi:dipeptidyl aminopeptidase/acylaminoacyl peptidase